MYTYLNIYSIPCHLYIHSLVDVFHYTVIILFSSSGFNAISHEDLAQFLLFLKASVFSSPLLLTGSQIMRLLNMIL